MKLNYVLFATFGFMVSCKNVEEIKVAPEAEINTQKAEAQLQVQRSNANPFSGQNVSSTTTFSSAVGAKINPPHGEPGHRCDIAVGAPLPVENGVSFQEELPKMPQGITVSSGVTSTENVKNQSVGKLNPPHGEPGHRCEIPVGAPLDGSSQVQNQQPAVTVSQPVEQQINVTPQSTQPVAPEQTQAGFSGKPNPPHGEPGHRCDIAVGATLP